MDLEHKHQCFIYDGAPSKSLPLIAAIIQRKLADGYRCLYMNSAPMVSGIRSTLSALGTNVASEIAIGRLVLSSDPVTKNGEFNIDIMIHELEDTLNRALKDGYKGLWASGDMTWEFGPKRDFTKLMQYELRLEDLFTKRKELRGICQYHRDTLPVDTMRQGLLLHPTIVINETLSRVNPHYLKSAWPAEQTTNDQLDKVISDLCRL